MSQVAEWEERFASLVLDTAAVDRVLPAGLELPGAAAATYTWNPTAWS